MQAPNRKRQQHDRNPSPFLQTWHVAPPALSVERLFTIDQNIFDMKFKNRHRIDLQSLLQFL
uniref:Uncharacterized protein n=1 Tax=Ralstonia solanacearum TaxID=305 RepID=A0A0S4VJ54_RALSL|nr:protein of unknown function [Ralstonia solanacearum]CUV34285.1 protein of unknown function [Ralstonia solanacearum]CUV40791.1 protein of unknown function [Ralstonia solanacearum]CUV62751.1 protein of unknown function [Ralstonia solanacearum]